LIGIDSSTYAITNVLWLTAAVNRAMSAGIVNTFMPFNGSPYFNLDITNEGDVIITNLINF